MASKGVGDRGLSGIGRKGKREGDRDLGEACLEGPQWVFRVPGFPVFESRDSGFFKQNGVRYGRIDSIAVSRMPKKEASGLRDCTKFGIAIAGLKNPLGDLQCSASFVFHEER